MILNGKVAQENFISCSGEFGIHRNPASIDLRVDKTFTLDAGKSILVSSLESVRMSEWVSAFLTLRTSAFRKGLALASVGFVDPGYFGTLTFRIINVTEEPITYTRGERIAQLVFHMTLSSGESYDGKYQGSKGVAGYKPDNEK